jgi:hypothetical protein
MELSIFLKDILDLTHTRPVFLELRNILFFAKNTLSSRQVALYSSRYFAKNLYG